jgi:hypothetical protein
MLEQAIVDAEALKEAAVKNAETLVLEKYSDQIKGAIETLLEQDEGTDPTLEFSEDMGIEAPAAEGPATEPAVTTVMENIPLAVTSENDDQIEIPLDQLFEEITKLNETMRFDGDFIDDPQLHEHNLEELAVIDDKALEEMLSTTEEDEEGDPYEEDLDEDMDLDEGLLDTIAEKLTVDVPGTRAKSGWLRTPQNEVDLAEEEILALEQDSEVREQRAAMRKAMQELDSVNESLVKENNKLQESVSKAKTHMIKLRDTVLVLDKKLQESNLNNAKLIYQNKALNSDSMNERQKRKLVESILNAETIEEAKVIFETLNNTVGSTSRNSQPNSLSEAVQKSSSMILSSRRNDSSTGQKINPMYNRWKSLAGIDNQ